MIFACFCKSIICIRCFLIFFSSSVSSDSACSSALRAYIAIGTTLPSPPPELPVFSTAIGGTPPKLSSQVAATLEST